MFSQNQIQNCTQLLIHFLHNNNLLLHTFHPFLTHFPYISLTICTKLLPSHIERACEEAQIKTRMHSSGMRADRSLTVCRGGGCFLPGGVLPSRGVLPSGGGCFLSGGGVLPSRGDASFQGVLPYWGVLPSWGVCGGVPACTEADAPCEQNHRHE